MTGRRMPFDRSKTFYIPVAFLATLRYDRRIPAGGKRWRTMAKPRHDMAPADESLFRALRGIGGSCA